MRSALVLLAALLPAATRAAAQTVDVEDGNVVLTRRDRVAVRLTSGGRDRDPQLSPDGRQVVFVRARTRADPDPSELWIADVRGGSARRLLTPRPSREPQANLTEFGSPAFSPDGRTVYFLTGAWATSGAVHALNLATGRVQYLCPGNSLQVVPSGTYAGHLMVGQHRYFVGGGSYDWVWLVTPDGHDVGPIGESTEQFEEVFVHAKRPR